MNHSELVTVRLCRVPTPSGTAMLGGQVAEALGDALADAAGPEDVTDSLGWRYRERPVGSETSTIESLLVPLTGGGFTVVVNAHRAPSRERAIWLAAHEIGHSFFYTSGRPPRRIVPVTAEEEDFCDAFAHHLLLATARNASGRVSAA